MTTFGPYHARVVEVHDGDTVLLDVDLGFDHFINARDFNGKSRMSCRIYGINAPELSTEAGKLARAFAMTLLPVGTLCMVMSYGYDKYGGRYNGAITLPDGTDFAKHMLDAGQAVAVTGW